MSRWNRIETAPKDGRHLLLAVTGDDPPGYGYVCEGYYDGDAKNGDGGWWAANTHWTDQYDGEVFPSHWMPLPEPPK